jgi:type II secretory pathway component PulL
MNTHEITINVVELASELAAAHLERVHTDRIQIWEVFEGEERYTEEAQDIFNDLYDNYYTLIESTKV